MIVFAFLICILVRATFYAYVFQFFTDVERTFDLTAFYNVFQGCTHNRVTFSRFYMKKIDAEIEFTVQTDTCSFLDVL